MRSVHADAAAVACIGHFCPGQTGRHFVVNAHAAAAPGCHVIQARPRRENLADLQPRGPDGAGVAFLYLTLPAAAVASHRVAVVAHLAEDADAVSAYRPADRLVVMGGI
eukprot:750733-Hanusia_phi.AAC.10